MREKRQRRVGWVRGWVLAAAVVALAVTPAPGAAQRATTYDGPLENVVLDWNRHSVEALLNTPTGEPMGAGQPAAVTALHLAMVHAAVYDAVVSIRGGAQPYLAGLPAGAAVGLAGGRGRHRRARRAGRGRAARAAAAGDRRPARRRAGRHARGRARRRRPGGGRRRGRGRAAGRRGVARRARRRRALRAVPLRELGGDRPVPVQADRPAHRQPVRLDRRGPAVPAGEPGAVPLAGAERADERRLRQGLRRGEGAGRGDRQRAHPGPGGPRPVLQPQPRGAVLPHVPHARGRADGSRSPSRRGSSRCWA